MTLTSADRLGLSGLVHRYAGYVDARRFGDLAELFTVDAELVTPKPPEHLEPCVRHNGHAGVLDAMAGLAGITRTHHGILGEIYTSENDATDTATGDITGVAHHWIEADGTVTDHIWHLRYRDVYQRVGPAWRIAARALTIDAIETRTTRQVRS